MIIKKGCNFDCDYDQQNKSLRITLRGEIDHHSAVAVRSQIDEKLYEFRPKLATMDLSKIDFMDSSGLGLIMGRYALMQKLGGDFCIAKPADRVMKIFELAGMGRIIKVEKKSDDEGDDRK